ncbi:hypothetical protein RvVAT039_02560 [Agrobacterium vitis]|nr:hypothetical protein RvVAT039_02560 [Agrobacterium vitis]
MILQLHQAPEFDELVIIDAYERLIIPHRYIDHRQIEVDDIYTTASPIFIKYPRHLNEDQKAIYRQSMISGQSSDNDLLTW